jgi:hypothetical protein
MLSDHSAFIRFAKVNIAHIYYKIAYTHTKIAHAYELRTNTIQLSHINNIIACIQNIFEHIHSNVPPVILREVCCIIVFEMHNIAVQEMYGVIYIHCRCK